MQSIIEQMEKLDQHIGKTVTVEVVDNFMDQHPPETTMLTRIEKYRWIILGRSFGASTYYFLEDLGAIKKITDNQGNILYENTLIPLDFYGTERWVHKNKEELERMRDAMFGPEIAERLRDEDRVERERWEKRNKRKLKNPSTE